MVVLACALAFAGCAAPDDEAVFRLDPQSGVPLVAAGNEQYQMDWRGQLVVGQLIKQTGPVRNLPLTATSLDAVTPELRQLLAPQLAGPPVWVYLAPQAPAGWHTCVAVTVQAGAEPAQVNGKRPQPPAQWMAQLFDADTGALLAELDLNTMYSSLTYEEPRAGFRAEVRSAYAGPDGGIGLLLWFAQDNEYLLDGGIWDGEEWTPLVCIQPSGGVSQDQVIYVGPGNASILQTPYSLFFSAADGRLVNMWILKGSFIHLFQNALIWGLIKALGLAAVGGSLGVAVLGFFWQLATARAKRRRLS